MSGEIIHRLDIWLEGTPAPIGKLTGDADTALAFHYTAEGIAAGRQLSLALPIGGAGHGGGFGAGTYGAGAYGRGAYGEGAFGDPAARAFFGNLLQENATLERVMDEHRIARDDIAGLLFHLGRDCPGAVSCVPEGEAPDKTPGVLATDYQVLSDAELVAIMDALAREQRLPDAARNPSPLAGVQRKIALCRLPDGSMALPRAGTGAPTTHILKVPRRGEEALVDHEHALMVMAGRVLQHPVAKTEIFELGDQRGLLVERFDRSVVDGTVTRVHQEDFAQALGIPASLKYGRKPGDPFSAEAIGRLLDATAAPAAARAGFRDLTLFNLTVGNTDNHAKNHALIYDVAGAAPRLAPLYDVVPVLLDQGVNHDFGFRIGAAVETGALSRTDYDAFLAAIGFRTGRSKTAERRQSQIAAELIEAVAGEAAGLHGPRMKLLADMIVDQTGKLAEALGVTVALPERDAFVPRGGGFLVGS